MRNGRRENHFGLDCVKNKNKISTNKKTIQIKITFRFVIFSIFKIIWIMNLNNLHNPNNKIPWRKLSTFWRQLSPFSCYAAVRKFQQIFNTAFVCNRFHHQKTLILVGTNKLLLLGTWWGLEFSIYEIKLQIELNKTMSHLALRTRNFL